MLAMILAGGRGSRLHDLTNKVAKPAVSYGGKYRIVDFPLSNCANSGVDVVGVLTQYESIQLNSYVAAGGRWGLDAKNSGVYVLPPREKADENLNVYRGTADAISQNIDFIDSKPVSVELPLQVICEVVETEPVIKGQTVSSSYKPAILDNGIRTTVPPFVGTGDKIVVSTADASYVERAK